MNNTNNQADKPSAFVAGLVEIDKLVKANRAAGRLPLEGYGKPAVNQQMTADEVAELFEGDWMIKPGRMAGDGFYYR